MSMTMGSGPFGHRPGGRFSFQPPADGVEYIEDYPRRLRAFMGDEAVIDSLGARMLWVQRHLPVWCFPRADVDFDRLRDDGAWVYESGLAEGLVGVPWHSVDRWLEEDEEVIVHPRDPYHRLEVRRSSRLVTVALDGDTLAESDEAIAVFETSLPARWYLPREHVRAELTANTDVRTGCAYKGYASYEDVRVGDRIEPFLVWHYPDPLAEVTRIADRVCFFNERVDLHLNGDLQERPLSPWSGTEWAKGNMRPPMSGPR